MARRVRAPGPDSAALERILAQLRAIGKETRKIETLLAVTPASDQAPLVARLNRIFAQRESVMQEWITVSLPRVGSSGAAYAASVLGQRHVTSALLRRTIQLLQTQTFNEVAASTRFVKADTKRMLRQIAAETTRLQATSGLSITEARQILSHRMSGIGLRAFRDSSGRFWKLDTYSQMLARTRTAQAYSTGTIVTASESGVEAFEVFDGSEDEACAAANGKIVSAEWAYAHTIAHPNCTRAFGPVPGYAGSYADGRLAA